ncbi:MAG: pyridoxine 5'-phosphate synthase [Rickettsiales bacterium]|nr:pyridoxine 5'-phosphate synthase [Rickettsiales bacterium]
MNMLRLGVNVDHVATLRNARGGTHPDLVAAALRAMNGGADGITAHLREDRRHICDADLFALMADVPLPLNFEMAATAEMLQIALKLRPNACCLVPEKREELTTEGGLNVAAQETSLQSFIQPIRHAGIRVSLFIDPDKQQVEAAKRVGADIVEFHTGRYCTSTDAAQQSELNRLQLAVTYADTLGLECHAGHGLTYDTVEPIAALPAIVELNIGHFIISHALFDGMEATVRQMKERMLEARR